MFFLLSAYLITELLLLEHEQSGTIAWGLFFARRALRIWPLYYAALGAAIVIALIPPHRYWISRSGIAVMSLFVAGWVRLPSSALVGHLWSISVEEQFYLIWPPIIKFGGETLAFVTSIFFSRFRRCLATGLFLKGRHALVRYAAEFLFFAAGAIIATRGKSPLRMNDVIRGCLLIAGVFSLAIAVHLGRIGTDGASGLTSARLYFGYCGAVAGWVAILFAILDRLGSAPTPSPAGPVLLHRVRRSAGDLPSWCSRTAFRASAMAKAVIRGVPQHHMRQPDRQNHRKSRKNDHSQMFRQPCGY
jgi:peptidoglycan/LPS O-acetylase OafA/YrhL